MRIIRQAIIIALLMQVAYLLCVWNAEVSIKNFIEKSDCAKVKQIQKP